MKTYKHLYEQIYPFSNLYAAFRRARRSKRNRASVAGFEVQLERDLQEQQAKMGLHTPPHISMEIEDITAQIAALERRLAAPPGEVRDVA